MKKNIILIILSSIIGLLLTKLIFNLYNPKEVLGLSNTETSKYYFIQLGVYSSYDSMVNNTNKLLKYIYMEDNNLYHVFGCITKNKDNITKLETYYNENGYNVYIKEFNLSNKSLNEEIDKTDLILKETKEKSSINELCNQSLEFYKTLIIESNS